MKIFNIKNPCVIECDRLDLYQYRVYVGHNSVKLDPRSSYWYIDFNTVVSMSGDNSTLESWRMCVEIFGYTPEKRTSTFNRGCDLPYINGCSTKQLIPPTRPGDPTFQMLYMPIGTSEQEHHIHPTARVVYVSQGKGISIVGTIGNSMKYNLIEGDVIILPKMTPHHFETEQSDLIVLPVHIYSSNSSDEFNHPMFNGTKRM
jgi:mannose-6-phosphate isomerase-like protein (cupin superfamily)